MPAHAKTIDSREKYGLLVVWALVVWSGACALMLSTLVIVYGNVWIGGIVGVLSCAAICRLYFYTKDLIRKTS